MKWFRYNTNVDTTISKQDDKFAQVTTLTASVLLNEVPVEAANKLRDRIEDVIKDLIREYE